MNPKYPAGVIVILPRRASLTDKLRLAERWPGFRKFAGEGLRPEPSLKLGVVTATAEDTGALLQELTDRQLMGEAMIIPDGPIKAYTASTYWEGYRDGVLDVTRRQGGVFESNLERNGFVGIQDRVLGTQTDSWSRVSIGADQSPFDGRGVKVALLDSGVAANHPDLSAVQIHRAKFHPSASSFDEADHGTHLAGIIAGPKRPAKGPSFGVAPAVELFAGKVLGADRQGKQSYLVNGMEWALHQKCDVMCLALGWEDTSSDVLAAFEELGARCLAAGMLIVGAAGNESSRPELVHEVSLPARARSILAVGAIDDRSRIYYRSNRGGQASGSEVDLVAPGVLVRSTVPPESYFEDSGTSMATGYVAGAAALWKQANPRLSGRELWQQLVTSARLLPHTSQDVGAGLVQTPRNGGRT